MLEKGSVARSDDKPSMAIVVGLGNPGSKYERTRHNIGFDCLNRLSQRTGISVPQAKFEGQFVKGRIDGRDVCLVWPMTYMNLSGRCVAQFARFYKVKSEDVLVICDDLSLPLGKLRIRKSGSSGGQKGLGDIIQAMGTQEIPRLRIGIDATPPDWDTADYVLSKFSNAERLIVDEGLSRAGEAIATWLKEGVDQAMNAFNRDSQKPT